MTDSLSTLLVYYQEVTEYLIYFYSLFWNKVLQKEWYSFEFFSFGSNNCFAHKM